MGTAIRDLRHGNRRGDQSLLTVSTYCDIHRVLLQCLDGVRTGDEATLRRAFAEHAAVTHAGLVEQMSSTTGVTGFVRRVHRLHRVHARVVESPVCISMGLRGSAATARMEFLLLLGDSVFDSVGFYTLRAERGAWEITRRVCVVSARPG